MALTEGQTPVTLMASILAIGTGINHGPTTTITLTTGGFPFIIPEGKTFYITHWHLTCKYPYDPPAYGGHMASMYFHTPAGTVAAHHPCDHFDPPYKYRGASPFTGTITNGMVEDQYIYAMVQGYLE